MQESGLSWRMLTVGRGGSHVLTLESHLSQPNGLLSVSVY